MNLINNDTQFASIFKESITSDYKAALLFMNVNPDVSLFKFRKILESLCLRYAEHYHYKFNTDNLCDQINELLANDFICGVHKESFHTVRMLTNEGVHDTESNREVLSRYAVDAREGVLSLLEDAFLNLKLGHKIPEYEVLEPGGQEHKDLWFSCLSSTDYNEHFRLGELYQELAEVYKRSIMKEADFIHRSNLMYSLAAECYKNAFQFCSKKSIESVLDARVKKVSIAQESHLLLFRYAYLCVNDKVGNKSQNDGITLLNILVKRGFSSAYATLGWTYYLREEYKKAYKYLTHKKAEKSAFIFYNLGVLYLSGKACEVNGENAIIFFKKAAELGCIESIFELGKLYHCGIMIGKDDDLAQQYLHKAVVSGHGGAAVYLENNYFDVIGKFLSVLEDTAVSLKEASIRKPYIKLLTTRRNEVCLCGSGVKYKKCCGK